MKQKSNGINQYLFTGLSSNQSVFAKYAARVIPFVVIIFTYNFPAAIMTYWCTNSVLSTIQVALLRQTSVRNFLNIPPVKVNPMQLDVNKKTLKQRM